MPQVMHPGKSQVVAIGAASVASTAFSGTITKVRLAATGACHVAFGAAPTATASSMLILPYMAEVFLVKPGDKVAVIQDGASTGNLSITEMSP